MTAAELRKGGFAAFLRKCARKKLLAAGSMSNVLRNIRKSGKLEGRKTKGKTVEF